MDPACRSMFATQPECGLQTFKQLHKELEFADGSKNNMADQDEPKWDRIAGQVCYTKFSDLFEALYKNRSESNELL